MKIPDFKLRYGDDGLRTREQVTEFNEKDTIAIAQVFIHELGHNQGLRHKEQSNWCMFNVDYVKDLKIRRKKKKPKIEKPKMGLRERRHIKAKRMVSKHRFRLKRQANLLKRWQRKVNYYGSGKE